MYEGVWRVDHSTNHNGNTGWSYDSSWVDFKTEWKISIMNRLDKILNAIQNPWYDACITAKCWNLQEIVHYSRDGWYPDTITTRQMQYERDWYWASLIFGWEIQLGKALSVDLGEVAVRARVDVLARGQHLYESTDIWVGIRQWIRWSNHIRRALG